MKSPQHVARLRRGVDVFGERTIDATLQVRVLGCEFEFVANDRRLLSLVRRAYAGLPEPAISNGSSRFRIVLRLTDSRVEKGVATSNRTPAAAKLHSGAGFLCGMVDADNFLIVAPQQGTALISVSRSMFDHPYHLRYEMIEFAVYLLAARAQGWIPLHAACVGRVGKGVLIIGASGAGKSTVALHCMQQGMEFLAEDSVLISPDALRAFGVANFLHLRVGADYFLPKIPAWIRTSPVIRRRSGVKKFEIDLRATEYRLAARPLQIKSVVFLSPAQIPKRVRASGGLLQPLTATALRKRLGDTQAYATSQSGWSNFVARISRLNSYVLHRAQHPAEQVAAIESLL